MLRSCKLAAFALILALLCSALGHPVLAAPIARVYHVSPHDVDRFTWSQLRGGDTVVLAPGTYRTSLRINARGTAAAPITIQAAGPVVFFGGRSTPLPYCGQRDYTHQPALRHAFAIGSAAHVVIDGLHMRGLTIHGYNGAGVKLDRAASNITLRNLHIYDNGDVARAGGGWAPNRWGSSEGIDLAGSHITVERAIIHDNAADAIQSGGGVHTFTLRQSWLYNERKAPDGETFNRCTHQDGIQIHNGGSQSGVTIEDSVIGPGLLQGIIVGDRATVRDVTIRNTRFEATDNTHVVAKNGAPNWTLDNITFGRYVNQAMTLGSRRYLITQIGAGASITTPSVETGSGAGLLASVPPWVRLALGGLFGRDSSPADPLPPTVDLEDIPGGACKLAAAYALEAMGRRPAYSQKDRLGPNSYDCSGLTHMAYKAAGVNIGWVVSDQMRTGRRTSCTPADLNGATTTCWAPGDLAVLAGYCSTPGCHISIYIRDGYFADCLNEQEGCKLWQPRGHWYQNYFAYGLRFDPTCAQERTTP